MFPLSSAPWTAHSLLRVCARLVPTMDTLEKRFLKAAQAGDLDEAKRLLVESPAVVQARSTSKGYTALHFAAMGGAIPVVEWLLQQGFDVMTEAPGGVTPLAVALEYKRFATVRRLQQLRDGEAWQHVDLGITRGPSWQRHSSPQLATARRYGLLGWPALPLAGSLRPGGAAEPGSSLRAAVWWCQRRPTLRLPASRCRLPATARRWRARCPWPSCSRAT